MGQYDDHARRRLRAWMAAHPRATLAAVGQAAGHNQPWASRYFAGEFDTGLDALAGMAAYFGQPLTALFDGRPDPREDEIVMRFRGMDDAQRQIVLDLGRKFVPDEPPPRTRAISKRRTDESAPDPTLATLGSGRRTRGR